MSNIETMACDYCGQTSSQDTTIMFMACGHDVCSEICWSRHIKECGHPEANVVGRKESVKERPPGPYRVWIVIDSFGALDSIWTTEERAENTAKYLNADYKREEYCVKEETARQ